jgi:CRISPR-associated protein Cas5 subtype I-B
MQNIELLNVLIKGWTATFRLPFLYSGTGVTSPVPPYSTILGMIGNMAAREMYPKDVGKIGYVFRSETVAKDLERTVRYKLKKGDFLLNSDDKKYGIVNREFHVNPVLDLYIENLELKDVFENPKNPPALGRSQDLCWVVSTKVVKATAVKSAPISGTLLPFPQEGASGIILVLPEFFRNNKLGFSREAEKIRRFQAMKYDKHAPTLTSSKEFSFYKIQDTDKHIYLHTFNEAK